MFSLVLVIGVIIASAGMVLMLWHQLARGPVGSQWISYLALATILAGGVVQVLGAQLSV